MHLRYVPTARLWHGGSKTFGGKPGRPCATLGTASTLALDALTGIADRHSFSQKAGGRERGVEDARNHYRKGVAGDWRHHSEPVHVKYFKRNYNDLLLTLGYETDANWV